MSNQNYNVNLNEMLGINDKNINIYHYSEEKIKNITHKIFHATLSYQPDCCYKCGCMFDDLFEKHGFISSDIKILKVGGYHSILRLKKQRYLCKHCHKAFTLKSSIVDYGCFISKYTKFNIAKDLTSKRSEKDIAIDNNVSPNTVERIIDSYYESKTLYKNYLPEVLSFDEFKSVKSADGAMSFHMCDGTTGQTIDIIEDRRLFSLLKYFLYYSFRARSRVKYIVIDMYSPYISLINKMFPNAKIIIDKFHLTQLISRSLNKTRILSMKSNKKDYKKLKRYWRLILKSRDKLDFSKWKRFTCFDHLMTEVDVVNYLINTSKELHDTYIVYQDLLFAIQNNNLSLLEKALYSNLSHISPYLITSINTLKEFLPFISNTFTHPYHNGFIEGNNNFIKVLKRIAFGFRSFVRFKARIMISKGLIKIKKELRFAS
jgi:transposase